MAPETVDAFCSKCGASFKMFLDQMATKNEKVVCPQCAASEGCGVAVPAPKPVAN